MARHRHRRTLNKPPRRPIRGKHYSLEVRSQRITYHTDPVELARPVADAIRAEVAKGIRSIRELSADGSHRFANRTGRLWSGIRVHLEGGEWRVSAPRGRLDERHWNRDQLARFRARLIELVPAIRAPLDQPSTEKALRQSLHSSIKVSRR